MCHLKSENVEQKERRYIMTMGEMSAADIAAVTRPKFMGGYGMCGGMGGFG